MGTAPLAEAVFGLWVFGLLLPLLTGGGAPAAKADRASSRVLNFLKAAFPWPCTWALHSSQVL